MFNIVEKSHLFLIARVVELAKSTGTCSWNVSLTNDSLFFGFGYYSTIFAKSACCDSPVSSHMTVNALSVAVANGLTL